MSTLVVGTVLSTWRVTAFLRFADHLDVIFEFEHLAKSFTHNHVVFRQ
jgi:hypothetical protein